MPNFAHSDYSLLPAAEAAQSLSVSLATLFESAEQEECYFLIDIPDAVEVYFDSGHTQVSKESIFGRPVRRPQEEEPLIRVHPEIEFLCLKPAECTPLIHRKQIWKKVFSAVGLMNEDGSVEFIGKLNYKGRYPDQRLRKLSLSGAFLTYEPAEKGQDWLGQQHQPTAEKSVHIQADSLLICAEDLNKIVGKFRGSGREYGKFEPEAWTSAMLADVNEASTFFFSEGKTANKKDIETWLKQRWKQRDTGVDVIAQASNAVLPDDEYSCAPSRTQLSQDTVSKYNEYASTALIIMNEAAKRYWKELQSSDTKRNYAKRDTIDSDLRGQGFTAKLASAGAAIIRPDQFKRRPNRGLSD